MSTQETKLKAVADAIREKDGTTAPIPANDFPEHIRAIPKGLYPQIVVTVDAGAVVTCSGQGQSFEKASEDGTVVFDVPGYGTWTLSAVKDGAASGTVEVAVDTAKQYQVALAFVHIYGATWDGSATTKLVRTDDAALFVDPSPAVGDGPGSSPFDDCWPWSGMVRVTQDGNELVAIPKYWVKVSHDPFKVQIADYAAPGFQVSPAHRDRGDGQRERDVVYIGRYECDSTYKSHTGQAPKISTPLATFRTGIHDLGAEYWQADYALQLTWWFLYIVEFADWDGQGAVGQGVVSASAKINTGATDSMTYHTGRAAGTDGQTPVQYRNIENLWGNISEWRDGIIFSDTNICTYNNPTNFKDTYNGAGSAVRSNKRINDSLYIKAMGHDSGDASFLYPSATHNGAGSYIPDQCTYNSGVRALNTGGIYSEGGNAGPFRLNGYTAPSTTGTSVGSRLMKLPNAS